MSATTCAACGFANPAGALFCGRCGTELGRPCPTCESVVSPGLAFCTTCGAPLEADDAPAAGEERKVLTVVFVDLVGFTSRAERLDPEDVRGLLSPYHACAKAELERFGGTVEKFIGDAVVAIFGAPRAHEDDPERGVRAALGVRNAIADLNAGDPSPELAVRIGVATGEAIVDLNARLEYGEGLAAGDVLNTASRLQSNAPTDGILVDEATQRATEHAIELRELPAVDAKGKAEPVLAWEAIAPKARLGVDIAFRGGAPLVGREAELRALLDAVARARRERSAQLVTLVGVPGIGKSRLVYELWAALDADPELTYWRQGRSLPYGDGVSYWALGEMAKAHAGILESDDAHVAEEKLRAAVAQALPDPGQARWVEEHLRPLIGLQTKGEPAERGEAFGAWRRFLEALAEQRPLVLVFEDLHWADDGLLDFVDELVDWATGVPLVVVGTTRPELLERRPGWGGGKRNAITLSLAPLTDEDTAALVTALVGDERPELVHHSGGNPLYAEEYARMVAQSSNGGELPLPSSVQGIIAARIDTLSPEEKALVQDASVLGKVFWAGELTHVSNLRPTVTDERLRSLERKEFVRRERGSSVAGETAFVFRHALVRDVAYGTIPRARRAQKHRLAAEWVESLAGDRPEDLADMIAHHYSTALDVLSSAGQDLGDLPARARTALRDAADRALSLNAPAAAARFYEQALSLWPESDPERPQVLLSYGRALYHAEGGGKEALREAADELLDAGDREQAAIALLALAEVVHFVDGKTQEAQEHLDLAVSLVAESPASAEKAEVLANRARFHMVADEAEAAMALADEAHELATELGLEELRAHTLNSRGVARTMIGDLGGVDDQERAVELAPPLSFELMRALNNLVATHSELGELERAFTLMDRSVAEARRYGHVVMLTWVEIQQLDHLYWTGEWDELAERVERLLPTTATLMATDAHLLAARLALAAGNFDGAVAHSAQAVELSGRQGNPQSSFPALANRAWVLLEAGETDEARAVLHDLLARWRQSPTSPPGTWLPELALTAEALGCEKELLEAASRARLRTRWLEAAQALLSGDAAKAAAVYERMGAQADAAITRLRSAELLQAAGRPGEAEAELSLALAFFPPGRSAYFVGKAEALLGRR
jgi:class 3 adenylate cyclase/tetratricopeptide (TPR) repeat protein